MDIKNMMPSFAGKLISQAEKQSVVIGARACKRALNTGTAQTVFLAEDADPWVTEPIAGLCRERNVECLWVRAMRSLGQACGIDVGAAAAAITCVYSNGISVE